MILTVPWSRATCPFCFERFHLREAKRRSTSPAGPKQKDERLGQFLSMAPPELGQVEKPIKGPLTRLLHGFFVPDQWGNDSRKICPNCHMMLPHATASGQLASKVIAIVGARSSGKSNYFGVLLQFLEHRYADEVGFTMYDQETFSVAEVRPVSSKQLYRKRYGERLFNPDGRMAIDQTRSARQEPDVRIPLIYRMEFPKRLWDYVISPLSRAKVLDLVIFDAAGEDMEDPTVVDQFYRYLLSAAGIIFIIDPFQFPGVRAQVSGDAMRSCDRIEVGPTEIVSRVIGLFETRSRLHGGRKITVPAAFAVAKSDALKGLIHPTSQILRDSRHDNGFNLADCERVSKEVIEYLRQWDGPGLIRLVRQKFQTYGFFAISALGQSPKHDLRIDPVAPIRIADPLLWLLWRCGYLTTLRD